MSNDSQRWILSFYRNSEIRGALFFGRLAQTIRDPRIQANLTHHFADESQHARYWTDCLSELDLAPIKVEGAYQDQYLESAGLPANLMEILAITHVFEKRVVRQYQRHRRIERLHPAVASTIDRIMDDEKWHIQWVKEALTTLEPEYGQDHIQETLRRFERADQEVYERTLREHQDRLQEFSQTPARR